MEQTTKNFELFNHKDQIPSVEEIINSSDETKLFVKHVTLNPEGGNWKIFRHSLNSENCRSFIYAFALQVRNLNPNWGSEPEFLQSNAKRLKKSLEKNNITLSPCETKLLEISIDFRRWKAIKSERIAQMDNILKTLKYEYLGC